VARTDAGDAPPARRSIANHVPRLSEADLSDHRFDGIDMAHLGAGHAKTFEHLARLAADPRTRRGRQMLAVLKADIDMLGQVFSRGLGQDQSLGRVATLSRMVDAFFTVVLPDLLAREFPDTYTVYAGGDDLLLLGPWLDMIRLSGRLAEAFHRHVGGNESITISAGIEFCGVAEPLNRAVRRAEARLGDAKDAGRRRLSLVEADPIPWDRLPRALEDADRIHALVAADKVPAAFVYKSLNFARARRRAEGGKDRTLSLRDADWRARWAYHLRRAFPDTKSAELGFFDGLLGSGLASRGDQQRPTPEMSLVIAIYRNR
jgi:CRISPR-associated protein Csm1